MKNIIYILISFLFIPNLYSQLVVGSVNNDSILASILVDKGVEISNVVRDCHDNASGFFRASIQL